MTNRYRMIKTRIKATDHKRLEDIRKKYGYKSIYEIFQILVHCFIRVADPIQDEILDPIPEEIEELFQGLIQEQNFKEPCKSTHSTIR